MSTSCSSFLLKACDCLRDVIDLKVVKEEVLESISSLPKKPSLIRCHNGQNQRNGNLKKTIKNKDNGENIKVTNRAREIRKLRRLQTYLLEEE